MELFDCDTAKIDEMNRLIADDFDLLNAIRHVPKPIRESLTVESLIVSQLLHRAAIRWQMTSACFSTTDRSKNL